MSLIQQIKVNEHSVVAVLDLKLFSNQIEDKSKRNIEKEGFYFLLNQLVDKGTEALSYFPGGKPYLKNRKENISLSHSYEKLVVIVNEVEPTGIDIELISDKIIKVRHKFLSEEELSYVDEKDVEKNLVFWAAKETLYKIQGEKGIDFAKDLFVTDFEYHSEGGNIQGNILTNNIWRSFLLNYSKVENFILVYMLNQIK